MGTVMNLDPSLFVYFAVLLEFGERGEVADAGAGGGFRLPFMMRGACSRVSQGVTAKPDRTRD